VGNSDDVTGRLFDESGQDPTAWFDQLYAAAEAGEAVVPWDHGGPQPYLVEWTARHAVDGHGRAALVVGSGPGFDAEHLASVGFATTAFDISPTAVASARRRFPQTRVHYQVADLLDPPSSFAAAFDLVLESLTVQSLPVDYHVRTIRSVASFVAPGGTLLVLASARHGNAQAEGPPWPLSHDEVSAFAAGTLAVQQIEELPGTGPTPTCWRAELRRRA
jgi:SAM-dependent methyltransferase